MPTRPIGGAAMVMMIEIALTVVMTLCACWLLRELAEAFGGLPPRPELAELRPRRAAAGEAKGVGHGSGQQ